MSIIVCSFWDNNYLIVMPYKTRKPQYITLDLNCLQMIKKRVTWCNMSLTCKFYNPNITGK